MEAELTQKFLLNCLQMNKKFWENRRELKCKQKEGWVVMGGQREKQPERKISVKPGTKGKKKRLHMIKTRGKGRRWMSYATHHVNNKYIYFLMKYWKILNYCLTQTRENTKENCLAVQGIRIMGCDPNPIGMNFQHCHFSVKVNSPCAT